MSFPGVAGKVAIVTGAGGGIGLGYARALAAAGAKIVIAEIDAERGDAAAAAIRDTGAEAVFVHVDVGSEESTRSMAARTCALHGGIDFLVNNAARFGDMAQASLLEVDWRYYQDFMNVNLNGALLCARLRAGHALPGRRSDRQPVFHGCLDGRRLLRSRQARDQWPHALPR